MVNITSRLRTLRPELATFFQLDLELQSRGYVGARILRPFQVQMQSGAFAVIKLKSLLANSAADTKRTSTGGYNSGNYEFEDRAYITAENGWEEKVDQREKAMYNSIFDLEVVATARAWEHVLNSLERRVIAATLSATVTAGQTTAATAVWTNAATSKPIDDIFSAQESVWSRTGEWPRTLSMARRQYRALRRSAQVIGEIQAGGAGKSATQKEITNEMLMDVLDVDEIIVADSIKNTANIAQTTVLASVFPESQVMVSKSAKTDDFKEPCLGRLFHWAGDGSEMGDEGMIGVVEQYEDPRTRADIIRVRHETSEFILYPEMAQVITGAR